MKRSAKTDAGERIVPVTTPDDGAPDFGPAIAELKSLNLEGLRQRWRKLHRTAAPQHLPRWLLFRILAYKIQADVLGDLDRETVRYLDQVADARERRQAAGEIRSGKKPPPVPPVPPRRGLKPGTVLVREYNKILHHVMVVQDGFSWNGSTYRSLSEAAFAITGTNWNGPRFFGLRSASKPNGKSGRQEARQ
jgi:hypothetical protein